MRKGFLVYVIILFLLIADSGCTSLNRSELYTDNANQVLKNGHSLYRHLMLTPSVKKKKGYSRKQMESFLSTLLPGYIKGIDAKFDFNRYYIKNRVLNNRDIELIKETEIIKWFEDKVSVVCRGNYTKADIIYIRSFFENINNIIGREKFVYTENALVGNIQIEFMDLEANGKNLEVLGYTMTLCENLSVKLKKNKDHISIDQSLMNYSKTFFHSSKKIDLSPVERDFMTKNRFVKIFINNIKRKWLRTRTISHELFHAIGFSGHSPDIKSCMFPTVYVGIPSPGSLVISKLDQTMIEMLYRPEILPAMTFDEVRKVISTIKTLENTKKESIWVFLTGKRKELERERAFILSSSDNINVNDRELLKKIRQILRQIKSIDYELKELL